MACLIYASGRRYPLVLARAGAMALALALATGCAGKGKVRDMSLEIIEHHESVKADLAKLQAREKALVDYANKNREHLLELRTSVASAQSAASSNACSAAYGRALAEHHAAHAEASRNITTATVTAIGRIEMWIDDAQAKTTLEDFGQTLFAESQAAQNADQITRLSVDARLSTFLSVLAEEEKRISNEALTQIANIAKAMQQRLADTAAEEVKDLDVYLADCVRDAAPDIADAVPVEPFKPSGAFDQFALYLDAVNSSADVWVEYLDTNTPGVYFKIFAKSALDAAKKAAFGVKSETEKDGDPAELNKDLLRQTAAAIGVDENVVNRIFGASTSADLPVEARVDNPAGRIAGPVTRMVDEEIEEAEPAIEAAVDAAGDAAVNELLEKT